MRRSFTREFAGVRVGERQESMGWNENINCFSIMLYHSKLINEYSGQVLLHVLASDKELS